MEECLLPVGSCVLVGEGCGGGEGGNGYLSGDEGAERFWVRDGQTLWDGSPV